MPLPPASDDLNSHPERLVELDLWPFELGTGAECQPWYGPSSGQFLFLCDFDTHWTRTRYTHRHRHAAAAAPRCADSDVNKWTFCRCWETRFQWSRYSRSTERRRADVTAIHNNTLTSITNLVGCSRSYRIGVGRGSKKFGDDGTPHSWDGAWLAPTNTLLSHPPHMYQPNLVSSSIMGRELYFRDRPPDSSKRAGPWQSSGYYPLCITKLTASVYRSITIAHRIYLPYYARP